MTNEQFDTIKYYRIRPHLYNALNAEQLDALKSTLGHLIDLINSDELLIKPIVITNITKQRRSVGKCGYNTVIKQDN